VCATSITNPSVIYGDISYIPVYVSSRASLNDPTLFWSSTTVSPGFVSVVTVSLITEVVTYTTRPMIKVFVSPRQQTLFVSPRQQLSFKSQEVEV
jgi:hypothetical protein